MVGSLEADLPMHQIEFETLKGTVHGPYGTKPDSTDLSTIVAPSDEEQRGSCWVTWVSGGAGRTDTQILSLSFRFNCKESLEKEDDAEAGNGWH